MKKAFSKKKRFLPFLIIGFLLLSVDVISKYWIYYNLPESHYALPFYPYGGIGIFQNIFGIDFCINRVTNLGGAWGIFGSYPIFLLIVRIAIFIGVIIYALLLNDIKKRQIPFFLILIGAFGNILDCFIYGAVIDMLHFTLWGYSFPVFNIADTMIFLGVAILILQSLFHKKKRHAPKFSNQSP